MCSCRSWPFWSVASFLLLRRRKKLNPGSRARQTASKDLNTHRRERRKQRIWNKRRAGWRVRPFFLFLHLKQELIRKRRDRKRVLYYLVKLESFLFSGFLVYVYMYIYVLGICLLLGIPLRKLKANIFFYASREPRSWILHLCSNFHI